MSWHAKCPLKAGSHERRKRKRKHKQIVVWTTKTQTQAQAPTQEMENFSFPCACVCACVCISYVWTRSTQTQAQGEKYSFESVRKYPVLFYKSCCDFKNKLKKQITWADVASVVGLQNGKCCDKKGKSCLFRKISRTHKRLDLDLLLHCIKRLRLIRRRPRKRKNNNTNTSTSSTILEYSIPLAYCTVLAFASDVWTSLCLRLCLRLRLRLRLRRTCETVNVWKVKLRFF